MSATQQGDVLLTVSADAPGTARGVSTITVIQGVVEMTGGFETAVLLSLFGGNRLDDGTPRSKYGYWGNFIQSNPARRYVSRVQHALRTIPLVTANLHIIREAALADLDWLITEGAANVVEVEVEVPALNRVKLNVTLQARGQELHFSFTENWKAMA